MRPDGDPPRADATADLRAAREALYRPDADPSAVARFEALRSAAPDSRSTPETGLGHELDQEDASARSAAGPDTAPPQGGPDDAGRRAPRPGRRVLAWSAAALTVGALGGAALGATTRAAAPTPTASPAPASAQQQVAQHVVGSGGSLTAQDYFRLYPDDLPIQWGGASTGVAFRRLAGDESLPVRPAGASSALLIVPGCPAADERYGWSLHRRGTPTPIASGGGACGGLEGDVVPLPAAVRGGDLLLDVQVQGPDGYSVTVLER